MLDKELERYYEAFADLFVTQGWKQLVELLETNQKAIDSVSSVKDQRDLDYRQGQLEAIRTILSLPVSIDLAVKSHEEAAE